MRLCSPLRAKGSLSRVLRASSHHLRELNDEVPKVCLDANITPLHANIFKKGDTINSENYRPICLPSIICKILKKLIKKEMIKFFTSNKLPCKEQHRFVQKKS